jgi:ribosomal protein S27E
MTALATTLGPCGSWASTDCCAGTPRTPPTLEPVSDPGELWKISSTLGPRPTEQPRALALRPPEPPRNSSPRRCPRGHSLHPAPAPGIKPVRLWAAVLVRSSSRRPVCGSRRATDRCLHLSLTPTNRGATREAFMSRCPVCESARIVVVVSSHRAFCPQCGTWWMQDGAEQTNIIRAESSPPLSAMPARTG